ncbi:Tim44 domain-containing protein [Magnetococcales bacterium HHB-1]
MKMPLRSLSLFAIALTLVFSALTVWPQAVEAKRFGGGSSFGSRASRSSTPARSTRAGTRTPTNKSSFGKGALMGGIGGLLLGGMIGSMLFGGDDDGGGGFGFLEFVLLASLIYFGFRFFMNRRKRQYAQPVVDGAGIERSHHFDDLAKPRNAPMGGGGSFANPIGTDDLEEGLAAIRGADPSFDEGRFLDGARGAFEQIQAAWADWRIDHLRPLLTDEMWGMIQNEANRARQAGERNIIDQLHFQAIDISEAWQERGNDYITVRFEVSMIDTTLNPQGQVIDGDPNRAVIVEEYWTFLRPSGSSNPAWFLTAIQQPDEVARGVM